MKHTITCITPSESWIPLMVQQGTGKDSHLGIVLAYQRDPNDGMIEYATWMYNLQDGGCFEGHYFRQSEPTLAFEDFHNRCRLKWVDYLRLPELVEAKAKG